jgi:hypothetical protein
MPLKRAAFAFSPLVCHRAGAIPKDTKSENLKSEAQKKCRRIETQKCKPARQKVVLTDTVSYSDVRRCSDNNFEVLRMQAETTQA